MVIIIQTSQHIHIHSLAQSSRRPPASDRRKENIGATSRHSPGPADFSPPFRAGRFSRRSFLVFLLRHLTVILGATATSTDGRIAGIWNLNRLFLELFEFSRVAVARSILLGREKGS